MVGLCLVVELAQGGYVTDGSSPLEKNKQKSTYTVLFGILGSFVDPPPGYKQGMRRNGSFPYYHYIALYCSLNAQY